MGQDHIFPGMTAGGTSSGPKTRAGDPVPPDIRHTYDVIVAGGGPSGTAAARCCAELGLSTLCVEEHGTIGHPVQCAGLLSTRAFRECRVSTRSVLNTVRGARVVSSLGGSFTFRAGEIKAYVVDRGVLDREMAQNAANSGVDFLLKTSVVRFSPGEVETEGVFGRHTFRCRVMIAADGPKSRFTRSLGLKRPKKYVSGLQADGIRPGDPDLVEVFPDAAPDFFGWVIPTGGPFVRIGLCSGEETRNRFSAFISSFPGPYLHEVSGTIPLGTMPRTYSRGILFVGDAAGLAKPTSGGGVYTGVRSARHAAETAALAIREGDVSRGRLSLYQQRWKSDFGRELAMGYRLFSLRKHIRPHDLFRICQVMDDPGIYDCIIRDGDMDRPSKVVVSLLKNRKMARLYGIFVRSLIASVLL